MSLRIRTLPHYAQYLKYPTTTPWEIACSNIGWTNWAQWLCTVCHYTPVRSLTETTSCQGILNICTWLLWHCFCLFDPSLHIPVVPRVSILLTHFLNCIAVLSTSPIPNPGDTDLDMHQLNIQRLLHLHLSMTLKSCKWSGYIHGPYLLPPVHWWW